MNRYNSGEEMNIIGLAMMEGRPIRIDRKTGDVKTISIDHPNVSVIGGIQPNTFKRALCADHLILD